MSTEGQSELDNRLKEVEKAWQWWHSELVALLPRQITNFFNGSAVTLRVDLHDASASFALHDHNGRRALGECDILKVSFEELEEFIRPIRESLIMAPRVELILPESWLLGHKVFLPLTVERNLQTVIQYEIDRLTPYKKEEALYSYRIVSRHPESDKLAIELKTVQRKRLDFLLKRLADINLAPAAVYPQGSDAQQKEPTLNLLPPDARAESDGAWNNDARRFGLFALALFFAVLAFPAWHLETSLENLQESIEEIRADATTVAEKQAILIRQVSAKRSIANSRNDAPGKLALIREITRLLPDNTWVSRLRTNQNTIVIEGESRKASDLIELLEQSPQFQNVRFKSSVTRNPRTTLEQYVITMDIIGVTT